MRIHEYQAKKIFEAYSIFCPQGFVVEKSNDLELAASVLGFPIVVKAQIHVGGRGKGGGIRIANTMEELKTAFDELFGKRLVTEQSEKEGKIVSKLLFERFENITRELYIAIVLDREKESPRLIAGKRGGIEVEEMVKKDPDLIASEVIDVRYGLMPYQARKLFFFLELDPSLLEPFTELCQNMYKIFVEKECTLCEINPLAINDTGKFVALDAKVILDDNALFRHPDLSELFDPTQEDSKEVEARRFGLNYVKLKGNVGCVANGAGLAMATMDLVRLSGKEPANFLDVGGGATREMIREGLRIVHSDPDVKVIFINIFGGILRCDTFAMGFRDASEIIEKPVIMRLEGTNVEDGMKILKDLKIPLIIVNDLKEALERLRSLDI
ncbi:MAG: ADP-forming succinate--CoA ligase subunit beta [Deltaproteobacteria bacterium]|nr:ADP-forming succinate--CoA ligase subunit beta [Deltaproteobacteria bacterium]